MLQRVPSQWSVNVIIVDDGSPCPAIDEVKLFRTGPYPIQLIQQPNQGVASARNSALDAANTSTLIAFLDSDDVWSPDHLVHAIRAFEAGYDVTFTDNYRSKHHESHVRSEWCSETARFLKEANQSAGIVDFPPDYLAYLVLKEFPTQASTVVYRREVAPGLRFDTRLHYAAEDMLFFTSLASSANRAGLNLDDKVECGEGINMFFANLSWDSPKFLMIQVDQLFACRLIAKSVKLSALGKRWNNCRLLECRRALAFHLLRSAVKAPSKMLKALWRLCIVAPEMAVLLPFDMFRVAAVEFLKAVHVIGRG